MSSPEHWLFGVTLQDVVPRRNPLLQNVFIGLSRRRVKSSEEAIEVMDRRDHYYARWFEEVFSAGIPSVSFATRGEGVSLANEVRQDFAYRGYTVNPRRDQNYRLYVVDLDATVLGFAGKKCVYVGQTSMSINRRINQHLCGYKASKVAHAFLGPNRALEPTDKIFHSQWDAVAEETQFGKELQRQGFLVWGPQGLDSPQ